MLSGNLGHILDKPLSSLVRKVNVNPNTVTMIGFIVTTSAAVTIPHDLFIGGMLILAGGALDVLDGIFARVHNRETEFGAFLDSVLDRYSDAFLFLGFSWYFFRSGSYEGALLTVGTMIGAFLVSYTRARAEGLGKKCHIGIMERPERIIMMAFGAITGWILPVMWAMIILTHVTVLQRIHHVRKLLR